MLKAKLKRGEGSSLHLPRNLIKTQLRSRKERESNKGKIANGHLESVPWNGTQKGNIKLDIILLWIAWAGSGCYERKFSPGCATN